MLLKKAAEAEEWNPLTIKLGEAVGSVLREEMQVLTEAYGHEKAASMFSALLVPGAVKATALTPDLLKALLGSAVLAGGAGGALAYTARQHTKEDSDDIEVMKERIKYYNRLAGELQTKSATINAAQAVEDLA